ncbi:hypothetical protein SKAU_G00044630 [Synaphobranchus kaupii]|uniref:Uncharacterized protein n=1 Tax=Synaphobranchus kaupii TaxID=118154 RepID=A0A9Q1G1S2_SYNKA|nr:hypothetical protein SKAU_G00044630 [Synaphobranchus kaupii]
MGGAAAGCWRGAEWDSCARVLLFRGANKEIKNYNSQTAFQVAIIAGNFDLAEIIKIHKPSDVVPFRETPSYTNRRRVTGSGTLTSPRSLLRSASDNNLNAEGHHAPSHSPVPSLRSLPPLAGQPPGDPRGQPAEHGQLTQLPLPLTLAAPCPRGGRPPQPQETRARPAQPAPARSVSANLLPGYPEFHAVSYPARLQQWDIGGLASPLPANRCSGPSPIHHSLPRVSPQSDKSLPPNASLSFLFTPVVRGHLQDEPGVGQVDGRLHPPSAVAGHTQRCHGVLLQLPRTHPLRARFSPCDRLRPAGRPTWEPGEREISAAGQPCCPCLHFLTVHAQGSGEPSTI